MIPGLPEYGRTPKPGLLHRLPARNASGLGTQAPGEGFAFTLACQECDRLRFEDARQRPGVELALALVGAKRASLAERAPIVEDIRVAREVLGLGADAVIERSMGAAFAGLTRSGPGQRRLVDSVADQILLAASTKTIGRSRHT